MPKSSPTGGRRFPSCTAEIWTSTVFFLADRGAAPHTLARGVAGSSRGGRGQGALGHSSRSTNSSAPSFLSRVGRLLVFLSFPFLLAVGVPGCSSTSTSGSAKNISPKVPHVPALEVIDAYADEHPPDRSDPGWKTRVPRPPPSPVFDPARTYFWYLRTSEGALKIELKPAWAPQRVTTTIYLTQLGFYDGLTFHRIIPKFMVQGGDPLGTGRGSPGFGYAVETSRKGRHSKRGVVAMANSGPRSEGSQFYILFDAAEHLDGKHTVFGQVVEGLGTLRAMENYGSEDGKPKKIVVIRRAEILVE